MKKSMYLYLFLFSSLIALIIYINGRNIQESQDKAYIHLEEKLSEKDEKIKELESKLQQNAAFSLDYNEEAYAYFAASGIDIDQVEARLFDHLLELNVPKGDNPLVPYIGQGSGFKISDLQVLNHKWLIANFTDNEIWGEVLIQYRFDAQQQIQMETLKALLYDKYH